MSTQERTYKVEITINKPVENAVIFELPKHIYNIIRSFVESSDRIVYDYNVGVRLKNEIFFIKEGKWILKIICKDEFSERESIVKLLDYNSSTEILDVYLKNGKITIKVYTYEIEINNIYDRNIDKTFFVNYNVTFWRYISLREILNKLLSYVYVRIL